MKLLFICTHNRCRSILAQAITNFYGQGLLIAQSAGSQPAGVVHPLTLKFLAQAGIPTEGLSSQSWDEHQHWQPDVVITVCDSAAGEACPVWFGQTVKVHWGLFDPSSLEGSDDEIAKAFSKTMTTLKLRVQKLIALGVGKEQKTAAELMAIFDQVGKL